MRCLGCLLLLAACCLSAHAADAVQHFKQAMSSDNAYEKRDAIRALAASSAEDDVVLPLLVDAIGDRQAGRFAVPALRSRTGLHPPQGEDSGGYPGYPRDDTQSAWRTWLRAREAEQQREQELEEALRTAEEAKEEAKAAKAAAEGEDEDAEGEGVAEGEDQDAEEEAEEQPEASGPRERLDRIFFTDGSILRCYVVLKRKDLSGNLTSVRILHQDGGGEEIIDAELISRIEEDYR